MGVATPEEARRRERALLPKWLHCGAHARACTCSNCVSVRAGARRTGAASAYFKLVELVFYGPGEYAH